MTDTTKLKIVLENEPKQAEISVPTQPNLKVLDPKSASVTPEKKPKVINIFNKFFKKDKKLVVDKVVVNDFKKDLEQDFQESEVMKEVFEDRSASQNFDQEITDNLKKIQHQLEQEKELKAKLATREQVKTQPTNTKFDDIIDDYEEVSAVTNNLVTRNFNANNNDADWDIISDESLKVFTTPKTTSIKKSVQTKPVTAEQKFDTINFDDSKIDEPQINSDMIKAFDDLYFEPNFNQYDPYAQIQKKQETPNSQTHNLEVDQALAVEPTEDLVLEHQFDDLTIEEKLPTQWNEETTIKVETAKAEFAAVKSEPEITGLDYVEEPKPTPAAVIDKVNVDEEWLRQEILRMSQEIHKIKQELSEDNLKIDSAKNDLHLNLDKTINLEKEVQAAKELTQQLQIKTQALEKELSQKFQEQVVVAPNNLTTPPQYFAHKTIKMEMHDGDFLEQNFKTQKLEEQEKQPTQKLDLEANPTQVIKTIKIDNVNFEDNSAQNFNQAKQVNEENELLKKLKKRLQIE